MRTAFGPMTLCLLFLAATIGCSPRELSPEQLEAAAVGTWRDQKGFPIELRVDKTLTTPIVSSSEGRQERSGTWSLNPEKREITLNIDKSEPIDGRSFDAATWTAYISKDGTELKLYNMEASMIESVKGNTGKDPGGVLRKD